MKKVLLIIGDAAELFDTMYPLYRVREDGYQVVVAGPEKRVYHLVQHDRHPDWDITVESAGYKLASDIAFRDIKPAEYAGMVITGGRAPEYIRYDKDLLEAVRWMARENRPIASVCHGIEVLATADVIRGKKVTTVAKCRFDAEVCGGVYVDEPAAETRQVAVADVSAHRYACRSGQGAHLAHRVGVARVVAAGHVCAGHDVQEGSVVAQGPVAEAFAEVCVQVHGRPPKRLGCWIVGLLNDSTIVQWNDPANRLGR